MTFATKCWNCGSKNFIETVSRECCPDCGIECDYWGGGANKKYDAASRRRHEKIEEERQREFERLYGGD